MRSVMKASSADPFRGIADEEGIRVPGLGPAVTVGHQFCLVRLRLLQCGEIFITVAPREVDHARPRISSHPRCTVGESKYKTALSWSFR